MLILVRPLLSSDLEVHRLSPHVLRSQAFVKAGTQVPAEAHLIIRLLDNVVVFPPQHHTIIKICKKYLSEVKAFHSGKALERQFISFLFSPT